MEVSIDKDKHFVCFDYPCIVENDKKMLETFGGEKSLSKCFSDPTKRIELRMRPQDVYCKPLCGDKGATTSIVMKVKRRKRKTTSSTGSATQDTNEQDYKIEMLGLVPQEVKFESLADLQYLPMHKNEDGSTTSLIDQLMLESIKPRSWLKEKSPLFIPPPIFSRIDKPVDYCYRDGPKSRNPVKDYNISSQPNFIGITRQRRPHYTKFLTFDDKEVATEPCPEAVKKLHHKLKEPHKLVEVKKMFEKRRIWSKNALRCMVDLSSEQFKYVLPTLAYYCVTGPWRTLWVKLGYDPRKDVSAKMFQTLDFRIRQKGAGDKVKINPKRSTFSYSLPNTVYKPAGQTALIRSETFNQDYTKSDKAEDGSNAAENAYIFRPGTVPPYRQMFYQLCDIKVPAVQALIHANDGKEGECTERDGWCERDCIEKCREILATMLKDVLQEDRPDEKLMNLYSIKPSGTNKGKVGKRHKPKSSSHPVSQYEDTSSYLPTLPELDVSTVAVEVDQVGDQEEGEGEEEEEEEDLEEYIESEEDSDEEAEENEMETEMLELMDPEYLNS